MDVGIWIRVSTEDQARGESPKNHEARARMYAEIKQWNIVELYDLSGVSGKNVLDNPEAKRMLEDVASGRIKALIFSKLARLARNTKQLLDISEYFQKYNASLISLEESIDTSSPAGRLLYTVIGALAQWEREEISARVAASIPIRAKLGKHTGGVGPFGFHWVEGKLIPNPEEVPVVKRAFELYEEHGKIKTVCKIMSQEGLRSRKSVFTATTIKRVLTDPAYKGTRRANYSRSKGNKKSWELKPETDWVFTDVPPLISEEAWDKVQNMLFASERRYNVQKSVPKKGSYLFSGLVICDCGQKMYVSPYSGMKTPRYICRSCTRKINEDAIEAAFLDLVQNINIHPEELEGEINLENKIVDKTDRLEILRKEFKSINQKIDMLFELYGEGRIVKDLFTSRVEPLSVRRELVDNEIPRLQAEIDFYKTEQISREYVIDRIKSLSSIWNDLSYGAKQELLSELIEKIDVGDDCLNFVLRNVPELDASTMKRVPLQQGFMAATSMTRAG